MRCKDCDANAVEYLEARNGEWGFFCEEHAKLFREYARQWCGGIIKQAYL
jgi:hypothetical protein